VVAERLSEPQVGARSRLAYLGQRVRDIYEFRYLVRYLASSALKVERVSFAFGFLWWLLDPIVMIALWTFVIVIILGRGANGGTYPFPLFLMSAMLPWEFMARSTRNSVALTHAKELQMRRIAFPRGVFPLSNTLAESVKLILALALFPFIALAFGESLSPLQLLALPLMPILMIITVGIGWFFSALNFVFRDTERLLSILLRLWLFLSPVIYSLTTVPPRFRAIYELNPMCYILECFRSVLLYHQVPPTSYVVGAIVAAVVTGTIGFVFFHIYEPRFARLN
jgi:lipopolysaccharide transport system permease protein